MTITEQQMDLIFWLQSWDPLTQSPEDDLRGWITDQDIRWLIDYYHLADNDARIFGMRYNWEHPNYSRKQRWMVLVEAAKKEKSLFN